MKLFLNIMQYMILAGYITIANVSAFNTQVMRPLTVIAFFLMALVLYFVKKINGVSADQKGTFIYIILNMLIFWLFPLSLGLIVSYSPTGILYAVLFATVFFPAVFMESYFTEFYAKKRTPEEFWATDIFKTINRNMTLAWTGIFALSAIVTIIPYLFSIEGSLLTGFGFQIILPMIFILGLGVPFNKKYPEYYMRKISLAPVQPDGQGTISVNSRQINKQQSEESMNKIKITAINGSPHKGVGSTSQMIQMIGSAIAQDGINIDLEEIFLADNKIEYCIGCGFCLENSKCWRKDDHAEIIDKLLNADGIILASPVYFKHVTAQMKTFIDRSLSFGHKPRSTWKPGLAVSVSAGMADTATAHYLAGALRTYGAFSIGTLTAIAAGPGGFMGKEVVESRARDLGLDLIRAIKEKRRYPASDEDYQFYLFMRDLVTREKDFMTGDYKYWQESGLFDGFEAYIQQNFAATPYDLEMRKEWLKEIIKEANIKEKDKAPSQDLSSSESGLESVNSCLELLKIMPHGFKKEAAKGFTAVYQFQITGSEEFSAYLKIDNGQCIFHKGNHDKPDVVIKSPAEVWLAISKREMDGQAAFMSGKYKVEGNLSLLLKLNTLFG